MKRKILFGVFMMAGVLVVSSALLAHHSAAGLFSRDVEVTLTGTVTQWRMVNPHPALMFDVENDQGGVDNWTATFNSVADVLRLGWNRSTFRFGDPVTVYGNPFFGDQKTIFPLIVTTPDGQQFTLREPRNPPPGYTPQ